MIELDGVAVRYGSGRDTVTAADGVSLKIPDGSTVGLVGESGSGKSTVAKALVGLLPLAGGRIVLNGVDHSRLKARTSRTFRRRVQLVSQNPRASLNPRMTIGETMIESLGLRSDVRSLNRRKEAVRVLEMVGLGANALPRYPHEFSGGQGQRIAIARALSVQPEVIVMDEVTSALDVSVQATILNLLKDLQREFALSYLFISHDLAVVGVMSDRISVMYLGQVVEWGSAQDVLSSPRHPYTRVLIDSVPRLGGVVTAPIARGDAPDPRNPPTGCRFHPRCPVGVRVDATRTLCVERDPQEIVPAGPHPAACHYVHEPPHIAGPLLIGPATGADPVMKGAR